MNKYRSRMAGKWLGNIQISPVLLFVITLTLSSFVASEASANWYSDWGYTMLTGDYDGDGDLDLYFEGESKSDFSMIWVQSDEGESVPITYFYSSQNKFVLENKEGTYVVVTGDFNDIIETTEWIIGSFVQIEGDFDGDGSLDLMLQPVSESANIIVLSGRGYGGIPELFQIDASVLGFDLQQDSGTDVDVYFSSVKGMDIISISNGTNILLADVVFASTSDYRVPIAYADDTTSSMPSNPNLNSVGVGAIDGVFDVSSSGKPIYNIPLIIPPSIKDVGPELSLVYSGLDSNGYLGVGWYIDGLSEISRCPTTLDQDGYILGVNFLSKDKFCLNGQRLKLISGSYGADGAEYRTENESFTKIVSYGSFGSGPDYFKVWKSTGEIELYGNSADSKRTNTNETQIATWSISEQQDRQNNATKYLYYSNASAGLHYIDSITFNGNSIDFQYENRSDVIVSHKGGARRVIDLRLDKIITLVGSNVAQSYDLQYIYGIQTGQSRVNSIEVCAEGQYCLPKTTFNWDLVDPPLAYTSAYSGRKDGLYPAGKAFDRQQYLVGDVNRDGRTDMVWTYRDAETNSLGWALFLTDGQSGELTFAANGVESGYAVSGIQENDISFLLGDVSGDGRSDLVLAIRNNTDFYRHVYIASDTGDSFQSQGYQVDSDSDYINYTDGKYLLADVNGDGRQDLVWMFVTEEKLGRAVYLALADSTGQYGLAKTSLEIDASLSPLYYSNNDFAVGDVNGDGKTDLLWLFTFRNSIYRVLYLANGSGTGFYNVSIELDPFGNNFGLEQVTNPSAMLGDLNGDGKADLVYTYESENDLERRVYRSSELGVNFDKVEEFNDSSVATNNYQNSQTTLADLNGDGRLDLLYTYVENTDFGWIGYLAKLDGSGFVKATEGTTNNASSFTENHHYLTGDINADGKVDLIWAYNQTSDNALIQEVYHLPASNPDHITSIVDGLGNQINVEYTYLSQTLYDDELSNIFQPSVGSIYPVRDDIGHSYVVSQVSRSNGIGGDNVLEYKYSGAKSSLTGRGFLGFESRTIKDLQTGFATTENFSQSFPYIGLVTAAETISATGTPVRLNYNHWASTVLNGGETTFRYLADSALVEYELNGIQINATIEENLYDTSNGNLLAVNKSVGPSLSDAKILDNYNPTVEFLSSDLGMVDLAVATANQYDYENIVDWRIGFLSQQNIYYTALGEAEREVKTKFTPLSNTSHLVLEQENYAESTVWIKNKYSYDKFGNVSRTETTSALADPQTESRYYTSDGLYLDYVTNSLGHRTDFRYNTLTGSQVAEIDANDLTRATFYDSFGRLVYLKEKDGREINYNYAATTSIVNAIYDVTSTTSHANETYNLPREVNYFDSLARLIKSETEGFDGVNIIEETNFDARGRVVVKFEPYFFGGSSENHTYSWDDLNRLKNHTKPDGGSFGYVYDSPIGYSNRETVTETIQTPAGIRSTLKEKFRNSIGQIVKVDESNIPTEFKYDSQGNLRWSRVNENSSTDINLVYDIAGNKTQISDPDAGVINIVYDGFAKERIYTHGTGLDQVSIIKDYDTVGRLIERVDIDEEGTNTSAWRYDLGDHVIGYLTTIIGPEYNKTLEYDLFGRIQTDSVTLLSDLTAKTMTYQYDGYSRPRVTYYPSGLAVENVFNAWGYLATTQNFDSKKVYRTITEMDQRNNVIGVTLGNGASSTFDYRGDNGYLNYIRSGSGNNLQNYSYQFDTSGNLYRRRAKIAGSTVTEDFTYDNWHRVLTANTTGLASGSRSLNYAYDNLGNLKTKSDVSNVDGYLYGGEGAGVHGVSSVTDSQGIKTYQYDGRGNVIVSDNRTIQYTPLNNPHTIIGADATIVGLQYNPQEQLMAQTVTQGSSSHQTHYYHNNQYELISTDDDIYEKSYVGDYFVHIQKYGAADTTQEQYLYRDHIGSVDMVTDDAAIPITYTGKGGGTAGLRMAFDPWGERRYDDWEDGDQGLREQMVDVSIATTSLGYTGHRQLDAVGLVHMKGRVYDPQIGRFLSPDFYVQYPFASQSYNRYSYVLNNPLSFTDPEGEFIPLIIGGGVLLYRAYSAYDTVTSGVADFETAMDDTAEDSDRTFAVLSLGSSVLTGKAGRLAVGKIKQVHKSRKGLRPEAKKVSGSKQPDAQGKDKNTQRKDDSVSDVTEGGGKGPDFIVGSNGTTVGTRQSQMKKGFEDAGFSSQNVVSPTSGNVVGKSYTLPGGNKVRAMEPDGRNPRRASFTNGNGGAVDPFTGKPPQPPSGLSRAERKQFVRDRSHVVQGK